jgi:NAD(P)H-hydrate epimerase
LSGEVRGISRRGIEEINAAEVPVVSIDIPSGLDAMKGCPLGVAVRANWTVTFALPKLGLLLDGGRNYVGELHVVDIGIPKAVVETVEARRFWMNDATCRQMLPCRPRDGHKGTFGRVLVLAGSTGMTGAAALSSEAALRTGAGLVTLGIPASLNPILEVKVTEVMTYPLPEVDGHLAQTGMDEIRRLMGLADVVAVGPGCGQHDDLREIIQMLLIECEKPLIIDADGLNVLQPLLPILRQRLAMTVLTPHPGEMARLTGLTIPAVLADRVAIAERFAADYGLVLVSKGAPTITALPDGRIYVNATGNAGMGTGGSGDVLTGMISGMLAQLPLEESVPASVYVHGLAGDEVAARANARSLLAGDLLHGVALAFEKLEMMNRR